MFQSAFLAIVYAIVLLFPAPSMAAPSIAVSKTPLSLPVIVAQEKGFFKASGVEPQLIECVGGFKCLTLMLENHANYATCSELPIVFTSFDRSDFVLLGSFVSNTEDMKLIVRSDLKKAFPESLKGKNIGIVANSASHYYLDVVLSLYGLDPKLVNLKPIAPQKLTDALASTEVDAIAIWEPFGYSTGQRLGKSVAVIPDLSIFNQTFNLVASRDFVNENLVQSQKVLEALIKASAFIKANPEESKLILKNWLSLDAEFVNYSFPSHTYEVSLKQSIVTSMLSQRKWAKSKGKTSAIDKAFSIYDLIDSRPLKAVSPSSIDLVGD